MYREDINRSEVHCYRDLKSAKAQVCCCSGPTKMMGYLKTKLNGEVASHPHALPIL